MAIAIRVAQIFVQFQKAEIGTEELYGIVTDLILEKTTEAANLCGKSNSGKYYL